MSGAAFTLRSELRPGDVGHVVQRHGEIYALEHGWDYTFEAYVGQTLSEFALEHDPRRERLWLAEIDGRIVGSIGIVSGEEDAAQLRWFLVEPDSRGMGIGHALMSAALELARTSGRSRVYLWTVAGLDPAVHLYLGAGFELTESVPGQRFGTNLVEERYDLEL